MDFTKPTATEYEKQRYLELLDNVAVKYEAVWGIGKLPKLLTPETQMKWVRQNEKLDAAVQGGPLEAVRDLVQGCIRAYEMMDAEARKNGHTPMEKDCWEVRHPESGTVYRIYKNNIDTFQDNDGAIVYSLAEIARILEGHQLVNVVKDAFPGAVVTKISESDWKQGDKIEF